MHLEISKYHKIISADLKACKGKKSRPPPPVVVERLPTTPPPLPPPSLLPHFMKVMSTKTLNYLLIWSQSVWSTRHALSKVTKAEK